MVGMEGLRFDAVRGIQAKREFYIIMCPFATIAEKFKYENDPRIDPELKAQRKIRESRIPRKKLQTILKIIPKTMSFHQLLYLLEKNDGEYDSRTN